MKLKEIKPTTTHSWLRLGFVKFCADLLGVEPIWVPEEMYRDHYGKKDSPLWNSYMESVVKPLILEGSR